MCIVHLSNPKVERYFQIETTREIFEDYAWNFVRGPHLLVGRPFQIVLGTFFSAIWLWEHHFDQRALFWPKSIF